MKRQTRFAKRRTAAFLDRVVKVCKRTKSEMSLFGRMSKQGLINPCNMDSTKDQPRRVFYEQDLVSGPMTQRRRLTNQNRHSTFCLDMGACAKVLHDTEHCLDFSDDFEDVDYDEDEESVYGGSKHDIE